MNRITCIFLLVVAALSQTTELALCEDMYEAWVKTYTSVAAAYDPRVATDNYGNVFFGTARRNSLTGADIVIIKYRPDGKIEWIRYYNGPDNGEDFPLNMYSDSIGDLYVTGYGSGGMVTIKYDSQGNSLWVRHLPKTWPNDLTVDGQGNVYITGKTWSNVSTAMLDYITVKYSPAGDSLWAQYFTRSGDYNDAAQGITVDGNGSVIVTGYSDSTITGSDFLTLKYTLDGQLSWSAKYDGACESGQDVPFSIALDKSGNSYVMGPTGGYGSHGNRFHALVKFSPDGMIDWTRCISSTYDELEPLFKMNRVAVDGSGNVLVAVTDFVYGIGYIFSLIKFAPNGDTVWMKSTENIQQLFDWRELVSMTLDKSGNAILMGKYMSHNTPGKHDVSIIKFSSTGELLWEMVFDNPNKSDDLPHAMATDNFNNVYVAGRFEISLHQWDYFFVKYSPVSNFAGPIGLKPKYWSVSQNYPNPFNASTAIQFTVETAQNVSIEVYNILGQRVNVLVNEFLSPGTKTVIWDGTNQSGEKVSSGVYYYKFKSQDYLEIRKMVFLK